MGRDDVREWQRCRSRFNHDWLKNGYIQALGKWINILAEEVDDPVFELTFMSELVAGWREHREELADLLRDFETKMSPRQLFGSGPLSHCDPSTKTWLPTAIHILWLARHGVRELVESARAAGLEIDAKNKEIEILIASVGTSASALRPFSVRFVELRAACEKLGGILSRFPNTVLSV